MHFFAEIERQFLVPPQVVALHKGPPLLQIILGYIILSRQSLQTLLDVSLDEPLKHITLECGFLVVSHPA